MRKFPLPACLIAFIAITGCGGSESNYDTYSSPAKPFTFNTTPVATDSRNSIFSNTNKATGTTGNPQMFPTGKSIGGVNPAHGLPGHRCDISVGAPLTSTVQPIPKLAPATQTLPVLSNPASTVSATAKSNPAHGQPGHRCDIAVGAPLNSPAQQVQKPASVAANQTLAALPKPAITSATGKLNPIHGQPGHRCDIAVGAPLNSPVKKLRQPASVQQTVPVLPPASVQQTAPDQQNVPLQQTAPVQQSIPNQLFPNLAKPVTKGSGTAKLNPAHGQPGHDCAIAVGQPLKG